MMSAAYPAIQTFSSRRPATRHDVVSQRLSCSVPTNPALQPDDERVRAQGAVGRAVMTPFSDATYDESPRL
jgi:hypothetical protein